MRSSCREPERMKESSCREELREAAVQLVGGPSALALALEQAPFEPHGPRERARGNEHERDEDERHGAVHERGPLPAQR
jgi:hypothetical protein